VSAPLDIFSQFLADLSTAAHTAGIAAGQITTGHWEQQNSSDNLWQDVAENGYYLFIEPPGGKQNNYERNSEFELRAQLIGSFPADESNNLQAMMTQTAKLLDAWYNFAPWTSGLNRDSFDINWATPRMIFHEKPTIGITEFVITGRYVAGQATTPNLFPAVS
jgi:hypothetical protein